MDDFIHRIQTILADGMQTLPVLLLSFPFFTGVLTANTGMLLLSILSLFAVNSLTFILNLKPFEENTGWTFARIALGVILFSLFQTSVPGNENFQEEVATKNTLFGISTSLYLIHVVLRFFFQSYFEKKETGGDCSILSRGSSIHDNPSLWIISVTSFIGFVFANAFSIFNLDTPVVEGKGLDEKQKQIQQKTVNDRVMNRKISTSLIMFSSLAFLAFALWFRLTKTNCEQSIYQLAIPISFTFISSFFLYYFIVIKCGIRAPDVLGITYDMIHPDMVNKPIVCVTN